ncbi:MAG: EF-P lysine aminoacylase GenX, partial [Deltaproteobacteria bacterium]|nr:EF-P lysine aminoacylase GenX [Deltaproteobacteria bacterium]
RDGERGHLHLPEFTMLEWYRADADYLDLMDECQAMVKHVVNDTGIGETLEYQGKTVDLSGQWKRVTVRDAFNRYTGTTPEKAIESGDFEEIMVSGIEPCLNNGMPVFLYNYPLSQAALSKININDPETAERFELYMGGLELANAFTELTDTEEQKRRFMEESSNRKKSGKIQYPFPERFIKDLEHMPPSAGIAFGVDRFVMLLANSASIDEVVTFTPERL